jgi:hypothetical protein
MRLEGAEAWFFKEFLYIYNREMIIRGLFESDSKMIFRLFREVLRAPPTQREKPKLGSKEQRRVVSKARNQALKAVR